MEKSKRLLTIVAIVAVITISGVALAINGNLRFLSPNLDLVQDFSDLVERPRQMTYPFTLTDLPEYFNASVIIEGSGYTGQPHTVYVLINHTRPDSSVWLATGNYSLTIENGVIAENITSGSFSDLRNTEPFVSPGHSWTPAIPADTYDIVLSLNAIQWTSGFIIVATAGTGGKIDPSGQFVVPEGADQEFTIRANTGYVISDILVDGESLIGFQPYTQGVGFGSISSDRTIEAVFVTSGLYAVGNATAEWSSDQAHSGSYSVKLYVENGTVDWAEVSIPVDIALKDIAELKFWEFIESDNPNRLSVKVLLGVDADGDGDFDADVAEWHVGTNKWNLTALNGDSFVEMEGSVGGPTTGIWTETDTLSIAQWWTPHERGLGLATTNTYMFGFYDSFANFVNVFLPDVTQTSLIPDADARVKCIKLVIGGLGNGMNETAYVDDLNLNSEIYNLEVLPFKTNTP